jgi:phage-related protein
MIEKMIEALEDEIHGAKKYAEKYIENMAKGNNSRAVKYKEMAHDELKHAEYIRDFAVQEVDELRAVYQIPVEVEEKWAHSLKHFMECMGAVRQMLS